MSLPAGPKLTFVEASEVSSCVRVVSRVHRQRLPFHGARCAGAFIDVLIAFQWWNLILHEIADCACLLAHCEWAGTAADNAFPRQCRGKSQSKEQRWCFLCFNDVSISIQYRLLDSTSQNGWRYFCPLDSIWEIQERKTTQFRSRRK